MPKDWTGNKPTAFVQMGASNHSLLEREENDFYATEPTAIDDLLSVETFSENIWECAVGQGHLAERLKQHGYKVQPMRCVEDICVFYRHKPTYNPQGLVRLDEHIVHTPDNSKVYGRKKNASIQTHKGYPKNLLEFKNIPTNTRLHPTQKPVALLEYLIRTYTNKGDVVLDNCMGSGSTGVACMNTNRRFIGFELDKQYFEVASERIKL